MSTSTKSSTILVAGATGHLGTEICRQLKAKNRNVRGLVRSTSNPTKLAYLKELGVETIVGDLKDKKSLENAVAGVSAIVSTVSSTLSRQEGDSIQTVDDEGQINLVDAAIGAGVNQFVYVSFCTLGDCPLQRAKRTVEKRLVESGMNYTILQPTYFMEVWLSPVLGFDHPNAKANIFGEGKSKTSWISLKDVAWFAVEAVDKPAAKNRIIKLGGPDALSPLEVVKIFETARGKQFELQFVPEEAIKVQRDTAPDPLSESFATLTLGVVNESEIDMQKTLGDFPVRLRTVKEYAEQAEGV